MFQLVLPSKEPFVITSVQGQSVGVGLSVGVDVGVGVGVIGYEHAVTDTSSRYIQVRRPLQPLL